MLRYDKGKTLTQKIRTTDGSLSQLSTGWLNNFYFPGDQSALIIKTDQATKNLDLAFDLFTHINTIADQIPTDDLIAGMTSIFSSKPQPADLKNFNQTLQRFKQLDDENKNSDLKSLPPSLDKIQQIADSGIDQEYQEFESFSKVDQSSAQLNAMLMDGNASTALIAINYNAAKAQFWKSDPIVTSINDLVIEWKKIASVN